MPTKKVVKKTAKKAVKKVAKKTVKKTAKKAVKKAAKKKVTKKTSRKATKKALVYANDEQSFWMTDGQILNSLVALSEALADIEKDVYAYHANGWQNDFAEWVDCVLGDAACAADLRKAKTPKSARTVVVRHLKLYAI
jgi:glucan-binding YG repeat protein